MRVPRLVRGRSSRQVVPRSFGGVLSSQFDVSRLRLRGAIEVQPRGVVLHRERSRHRLPRGPFVEVERRHGVGIALALGGLRERLKPPSALLRASIHPLERRRSREDVGDESPVAAKLVHDGAQELVLHRRPRSRRPRRAFLRLVRFFLIPRLALLLQRRERHAVVLVVRRILRRRRRTRASALRATRAGMHLPFSLGVVLVELPGGGGRRARMRLRGGDGAASLVRATILLRLGGETRGVHDGALATLLALLPVAKSSFVLGEFHSLGADGTRPPPRRRRPVALVRDWRKRVRILVHARRRARRHGRQVQLGVENRVWDAAREVHGRRRGHGRRRRGRRVRLRHHRVRGFLVAIGGGGSCVFLFFFFVLLLLLLRLVLGAPPATSARGRRLLLPAPLRAFLGALLGALLVALLLLLLLPHRVANHAALQSSDIRDELRARPLFDHLHSGRGRRRLGEDGLGANRRHGRLEIRFGRRRRDVGGGGGGGIRRSGSDGVSAVRLRVAVRLRHDDIRGRRLLLLRFGRCRFGLYRLRRGGAARRATRIQSRRDGGFAAVRRRRPRPRPRPLRLARGRRHELCCRGDWFFRRAIPRFAPERRHLRRDARARSFLRRLGIFRREGFWNPLRRRHRRAAPPRALRLPISLRGEIVRHPSHLDQDVIPVRLSRGFAVRSRRDLRAEHRATVPDGFRAFDRLRVFAHARGARLVRLLAVGQGREGGHGDGFSRGRSGVEFHGGGHVDDPFLVIRLRLGGGGGGGGVLGAFRLRRLRGRALGRLRTRHGGGGGVCAGWGRDGGSG